MASTNKTTKATPVFTHEGAKAAFTNDEQKLRRSVMSCLLWENEFYEDGKTIANRIAELIPKVKPEKVAQIALEARNQMKLRHIPLFITREMARSETTIILSGKERAGKSIPEIQRVRSC